MQNFYASSSTWGNVVPFTIQIGTMSNSTTFIPIRTEVSSALGSGFPADSCYLTWTLDTPQTLLPNTVYAFYVTTTASWLGMVTNTTTGSNPYAGGGAFSSISSDAIYPIGGGTVTPYAMDRIFDIALTGIAVPEPATWAMALGGFGMLIVAQRMRCRNA